MLQGCKKKYGNEDKFYCKVANAMRPVAKMRILFYWFAADFY